MLFLLHLVSKMQPTDRNPNGSRIAIVMNGSPLFSGGAGSGESEIRKYLFENDLIEAIVGLPTEMFYNTGIATYIWILSNNKANERRGKTQLIDATSFWKKMPKSLGNKRRFMDEEDIAKVIRIYGDFEDGEFSKVLPNEALGYRTITVERPLRLNFQITSERLARLDDEKSLTRANLDLERLKTTLVSIGPAKVFKNRSLFLKSLDAAMKKSAFGLTAPQYKSVWQGLSERDDTADICPGARGKPEPDPDLRDTENVPLSEDVQAYFEREVEPHVADAWIDHGKTKIGYEVPFTRYFYRHTPPRPLSEIDADLSSLTAEIVKMLSEVTA
jgi:type I restriction enzyme M protein